MKKVALSREEALTIENLRLKVRMAEMQHDAARRDLSSYTRELLLAYGVPSSSQAVLYDGYLEITDVHPQGLLEELPSPPPAKVVVPKDTGGPERVLSQAELRKLEAQGKGEVT